jgi:hypothetical protein
VTRDMIEVPINMVTRVYRAKSRKYTRTIAINTACYGLGKYFNAFARKCAKLLGRTRHSVWSCRGDTRPQSPFIWSQLSGADRKGKLGQRASGTRSGHWQANIYFPFWQKTHSGPGVFFWRPGIPMCFIMNGYEVRLFFFSLRYCTLLKSHSWRRPTTWGWRKILSSTYCRSSTLIYVDGGFFLIVLRGWRYFPWPICCGPASRVDFVTVNFLEVTLLDRYDSYSTVSWLHNLDCYHYL